jgi:hypothetical protein
LTAARDATLAARHCQPDSAAKLRQDANYFLYLPQVKRVASREMLSPDSGSGGATMIQIM